MTRQSLPAQQRAALDYIEEHIEMHDQSPSYEEIGRAIGSKRQNVMVIIRALEEKGFIAREPYRRRSIVVV